MLKNQKTKHEEHSIQVVNYGKKSHVERGKGVPYL